MSGAGWQTVLASNLADGGHEAWNHYALLERCRRLVRPGGQNGEILRFHGRSKRKSFVHLPVLTLCDQIMNMKNILSKQDRELYIVILSLVSYVIGLGLGYGLATALWVMPLKQSAAITIVLLLIWAGVALYIIRRMSAPGGRLSKEREQLD